MLDQHYPIIPVHRNLTDNQYAMLAPDLCVPNCANSIMNRNKY